MNYIFSSGTARGGTALTTRMLSVNEEVEIALDPYLPLYKSFRNAIAEKSGLFKFISEDPISDYYHSNDAMVLLDEILNAKLDINFPKNNRLDLITSLKNRSLLSSGDITAHIEKLNLDGSIGDAFESALSLIKNLRKPKATWIGIHENWTVEFLKPLAHHFNDAKFLITLRDPRAVICSSLNVKNVSERGQILSYSRGLRKLMACAYHFRSLPIFKERLKVVRHEDVVKDPEKICKEMCDFLNIEFKKEMLDTNNFVEASDGSIYNGISSFEKEAKGISQHRATRWRKYLHKDHQQLIEFLCGPEMNLFGYKTDFNLISKEQIGEVISCLEDDIRNQKVNWRTDTGNLSLEIGSEIRRWVLSQGTFSQNGLVDRSMFLFDTVKSGILEKKLN